MSSFIAACIWSIAANVIAMIPDGPRFQIHWNLARLLVLALPVLIYFIGVNYGVLWQFAMLAVAVFQLRLMLRHMFRQALEKWRAR